MTPKSLTQTLLAEFNRAAESAFGQTPSEVSISSPPNVKMGDFAIECFPLAKQFRKSPKIVAEEIVARLETGALIRESHRGRPLYQHQDSERSAFQLRLPGPFYPATVSAGLRARKANDG